MSQNKTNARPIISHLLRVLSGVSLGFILYYAAARFATYDCQTMQLTVRSGGLANVLALLAGLILLLMVGIPSAVIGIISGMLAGPILGAPIASASIVVTSLALWLAGKTLASYSKVPLFLTQKTDSSPWLQHALNQRSKSGFHWIVAHGVNAPMSYPYFSFIIGTQIPHMTFLSVASGIFAGSVLYLAGYALAGASIGCAVINHAIGTSFEQYKPLMLVSCLILLMLSRVQATFD